MHLGANGRRERGERVCEMERVRECECNAALSVQPTSRDYRIPLWEGQ